MPSAIQVELKGLRETQKNLEQAVRDLRGTPTLDAMRDSTLLVERDAKRGLVGYQSPTVGGVDSGILRASITPEVTLRGNVVMGVVGSNKQHAPFVELDTKPHWPPIKALELWAKRHHAVAFLVARAISKRGTFGKHFLENAFVSNKEKIIHKFEKVVADIARRANK